MMNLIRVLAGGAFLYVLAMGRADALADPQHGDLQTAFNLATAAAIGLVNAVVWAPLIGDWVSRPLTQSITESTYYEARNGLTRLIRALDGRHWRRLAMLCCFWEGIRHPWLPEAFITGFRNARPGSWLEKIFAREVYRFDNAQHCVAAYQVLQKHGIEPGLHHRPDISILIRSLERAKRPESSPLAVPTAPPVPPPQRDRRIKLFEGAPMPPVPAAEPPPVSSDPGSVPSSPAAPPKKPDDTILLPCFTRSAN